MKAQDKLEKGNEKHIIIENEKTINIINKEISEYDIEKEREKNLQKIKGFFKLMDGINNLTKKEAMDKILPNLENYLRDKNLQTKLKNILKKKPKYENNLLRKSLFKWYSKKGRQNPEKIYTNDETEDVANKIKDLKKSIYMKSIIIKYQKEDKNKVRKCFYKWYKKVIFMKIKEEITKSKS